MALAYPEGECFFKRSALNAQQQDGYHADNCKDFYSHIMVEYIWNQEAYHGSTDAKTYTGKRSHPRSEYRVVNGDWWNTDYGVWCNVPFSYGPTPNDIKRRFEHNLCTWGNRIRDREKGASAELLGYIRAIYIPIAQQSDENYPDLCTFIQVNFTQRGPTKVWRPYAKEFRIRNYDKTFGVNLSQNLAIGLDIYGLLQLLTLPRQLRVSNAYAAKLISIVQTNDIKTVPVSSLNLSQAVDQYDFSFTKIASANFGLEVQWKPYQSNTWFAEYVRNSITFALGFVPGVGFILAISFSLGWSALTDPDNFYDTLRSQIPAVILTEGIIQELKESAEATKKLLPPGWDVAGKALQMPPTQIKGGVGGDDALMQSLDETIESYNFFKAAKVLAKSGSVGTPAADDAV